MNLFAMRRAVRRGISFAAALLAFARGSQCRDAALLATVIAAGLIFVSAVALASAARGEHKITLAFVAHLVAIKTDDTPPVGKQNVGDSFDFDDVLVNILGELDVEIVRVTVTELRENTFYASITVQQNGSELEIDSRSSDAIAVAIRAHAPIYAADSVIEESAIEFEGEEVNEDEIVDEFRKFLDNVTPAEFEVGLEEGGEERSED